VPEVARIRNISIQETPRSADLSPSGREQRPKNYKTLAKKAKRGQKRQFKKTKFPEVSYT